jgi:hypothetical protein
MLLQEVYNKGVGMYGVTPMEFTDKGTWHSYINTYQEIFNQYPNSIKILDIGVHSGGSLWLWSNYLKSYKIWGMDISPTYERKRPFQDDITNDSNITTLWNRDSTKVSSFEDVPNEFDLIIDDGDHRPDSQINTFFVAWPKLNNAGIYIIEDVSGYDNIIYIINKIKKVYSDLKFEIYVGNNREDDILIKIRK